MAALTPIHSFLKCHVGTQLLIVTLWESWCGKKNAWCLSLSLSLHLRSILCLSHYLSTLPSLYFKCKCIDWFLKGRVPKYDGDFNTIYYVFKWKCHIVAQYWFQPMRKLMWRKKTYVGFVCRTKTMHRLLCFKSKFPNHFAFTLGSYLFLLFLVHFKF